MTPLLYAFPGSEAIAAELARELGAELADVELRRFPDRESYVRLIPSPAGRSVILLCGLDRPDEKIIPVYFAACAARELGAARVGLVAPYLGYMRQDARFKPGEAVTSTNFAHWLSQFVDWLVTVDPHLHRHATLSEIYSIPTAAVAAAPAIARWLLAHVRDPVLIGPDAESRQWVEQIATAAACPFVVCSKQRGGDRDVAVSLPDLAAWRERTPVLVDDIVSTGRTLLAAMKQLRAQAVAKAPLCVGVHALFADNAYADLSAAGAAAIVTSNTIAHASNAIDVIPEIASAAAQLWVVASQ